MTRNSGFEELSMRQLENIQFETFEIAVSRRVMLQEKPAAENDR
jgi:hypothetical protein